MPGKKKLLTFEDVSKHNKSDDLWVILDGKAYDLTDFAPEHPGGAGKVVEQAGGNGTEAFIDAHPLSIMKLTLGPDGMEKAFRGDVDPATIPSSSGGKSRKGPVSDYEAPPLAAILNLHDFEAIAERRLIADGKQQAWDYYSSGADDELTYKENVSAFQRIWLRPRILVDVKDIDTSTTIMGVKCRFPVYLSAVAMCGMGHQDGEIAWMRAAYDRGVLFMMPNLSSKSFEDMVAAKAQGQDVAFQMYVNPDRDVVIEQLRACEEAGVKALCITVDSAVPGKRERDRRNKIKVELGDKIQDAAAAGTRARKPGTYANRDPALSWSDIKWFKKQTDIPLVLKGVACGEDAVLAGKAGVSAIILSNHGGRNLDTSRSGVEILPEVMVALQKAKLADKIDVYVDGGIRRGTDIVKCLALGAKAVGVGKPAVFSMSAYGEKGIVRMLDILEEELVTTMRLCGAPSLEHITRAHVDDDYLSYHAGGMSVPPSPYALSSVPTTASPGGDVEKLKAKISSLEEELRIARRGEPGIIQAFFALLMVMIVSTSKTVFAKSTATALHRSALFLVVFLVVHLLGNLTMLISPAAFNAYAHHLSTFPTNVFPRAPRLLPFVEMYLFAGAVVHAGVALYLSWTKRKFLLKNVVVNAQLLLTSLVVVAFVVSHIFDFRLGKEYVLSNGARDMYRNVDELFVCGKQVVWYVVGIAAVGVHLWLGWTKTVNKMEVGKEFRAPIVEIGHSLVIMLCLGFAFLPVYVWSKHQNTLPPGA